MESVSLSINDIKKALTIIRTAKANMPKNWYDWIETVIIDENSNIETFNRLKSKFIKGEEFLLKDWEQSSNLKKIYPIDMNLRFKSKEYIKTGKGKFKKNYHLTLIVPIVKIIEVLNVPTIHKDINCNYIISCEDNCMIIRIENNRKLDDMVELCKILQLSANYHLYDCGYFDISNISQNDLLSNLHKFKKLI